jgi:ectoine hydroxylase-related dioxygenase (phytanoyl-CoA dioxygenase family)
MHEAYPAIREIWLYPSIHRMLALIFDEPSEPSQSLVCAFGSQQDARQDTIHFTPFSDGHMCGVWAALEDVREGSGELFVDPGSHRLPRVYLRNCDGPKVDGDWSRFGQTVVNRWEALVAESGIKPRVYDSKGGSIPIWRESLMHAGSLRADKSLSRRTVITHHFARGSIVYHDSTGMEGRTCAAAGGASSQRWASIRASQLKGRGMYAQYQ